jgi:hypothetical protein
MGNTWAHGLHASSFVKSGLGLVCGWEDRALQECNLSAQIVHFSGHGSQTEELVFHDQSNNPKPVSKAALQALFESFKGCVRLVILNACYSGPQAEAIVSVIDCAIGMRRSIGDTAATVFAASFYRAIGFGHSVKESFEQGRTALLLEGIREEDTPDLLVKKGADAAKIYLAGPNL